MTLIAEVEHDLLDLLADEEKLDPKKFIGPVLQADGTLNLTGFDDKAYEEAKGMTKNDEFTAVKDSGQRQEFSTGAVRDTQTGKGFPHLLPTHALFRLARHFENGAKKYGKDNWRKGIPLSRYLDSAFRHWCAVRDCEKDEDHAASVLWNMACFIETAYMIQNNKLPKELDDIGWLNNEDIQVNRPN